MGANPYKAERTYLVSRWRLEPKPEDMEKYKNKRGFIFDNPKEYMPGPEIRNLSDIEEFIENIVSGNDLYKEARESVNDKINYYKDGNCCKRVAETFIK